MKKTLSIIISVALLAIGGGMTACKSKQMTVAQQAQQNVGRIKKERDECQEMALKAPDGTIRAWGEGVSMKESFANNLAELDARTKIARQLEMAMESLISSFNEQYAKDGVLDESGKANELQQGYVSKILTGTVPVCSNVYILPDGKNQVYVCIELSAENVQNIVKRLSAETKLDIDFAEHNYRKEMEKAREQFNREQEL